LDLAESFLLRDNSKFGPGFANCCNAAFRVTRDAQRTALLTDIRNTIAPFDIAGLSDINRRNWYPALAKDFITSSHKLGATREQAIAVLKKSGFSSA
jgi:hypothetical protein